MVINIRATNGAGKSTIVKQLMAQAICKPIYGTFGPKFPEAYQLTPKDTLPWIEDKPLYIIGPYHSPTGGIDAISGRGLELVIGLLDKYVSKGHMLFEGMMISTAFGSIGEWLEKHKAEAIVAVLDTPLEVCLNSLRGRQATSTRSAGGEKHVEAHWNAIQGVAEKMKKMGMRVETLERDRAAETIRGWLQ